MTMTAAPQLIAMDSVRTIVRTIAVWLYIATLLWAPFPLGGAIAWAAGVQEMAVALCFILWMIAEAGGIRDSRRIAIPAVLIALSLFWAVVQIAPIAPQNWVHPIWGMASDALGLPVRGTISINPWRTETEIAKLSSYVMAGWLAYRMARKTETAKLLINAVIIIGTIYAVYAFVLEFSGAQQVEVFYSVPYRGGLLSGPFLLHNSFATYSGLAALAAVAKLLATASSAVSTSAKLGRRVESILQFCFGGGAPLIISAVLTFAGVVASASRAGFAATMCGLIAMALASLAITRGRGPKLWASVGTLAAAAPILFLIIFNGGTLGSRVDQLLASDTADAIRFSLWASTQRMISDAPWLGLGLGSFQDAYPMYASQTFPYVMDKAHCDYLEFAAGLGLPAAIAWWAALVWLSGLCVRGVFVRHRNRLYAIIAVGGSVLVGVHSSVDFSLQLPAVALSYVTLLGIGVAQCQANRRR